MSTTSYLRRVDGTPQTCIDLAVDIAAANFSGAPAVAFDNTTDGLVPKAPWCEVMAEFPDWASAPAAGNVIELWGSFVDVDGTEDDTDDPSGTSAGGATFFGSFPVAAVDAPQRRTIIIFIGAVKNKMKPFIKNGTAVNMNNDGGTNCIMKFTPFTYVMYTP